MLPSDQSSERPTAVQAGGHTSLDFKCYSGSIIVVRGSVGNLENLHFLIDTGTNQSVVDRRLASRLGLTIRHGRMGVLGHEVSAEQAVLADIKLGPLTMKSLSVSALDLRFLGQSLHVRIDMLIGLDMLGQRNFSIDYESKRLVFGHVPALPLALPMESGPPFVTVLAHLDGVSYRLLVNTAASRVILFNTNKQGLMREIKIERADIATNSAGEEVVCKQARLGHLRLGDKEFTPGAVCLVNDEGKPYDGLLPIPALGFKEVAFDFERHILWLRK
jgi:predicted aspartyl protease